MMIAPAFIQWEGLIVLNLKSLLNAPPILFIHQNDISLLTIASQQGNGYR